MSYYDRHLDRFDSHQLARRLRLDQTPAERRLWQYLRARRLGGFKFRRQHPIGPYIVDFVCMQAELVIELDGKQHFDAAREDAARTEHLRRYGFRVIRFWNEYVLRQTMGAVTEIEKVLLNKQTAEVLTE